MKERTERNPENKKRLPEGWKAEEGTGRKRGREEEDEQAENSSGKKKSKIQIFRGKHLKTSNSQ